mmetsp:Transcript_25026/g.52595  ORF Transcript_25026/g.52595 Transcript_25026/m.52595 type:complete len:361 (+) Transcript_25026:125-1207(+)
MGGHFLLRYWCGICPEKKRRTTTIIDAEGEWRTKMRRVIATVEGRKRREGWTRRRGTKRRRRRTTGKVGVKRARGIIDVVVVAGAPLPIRRAVTATVTVTVVPIEAPAAVAVAVAVADAGDDAKPAEGREGDVKMPIVGPVAGIVIEANASGGITTVTIHHRHRHPPTVLLIAVVTATVPAAAAAAAAAHPPTREGKSRRLEKVVTTNLLPQSIFPKSQQKRIFQPQTPPNSRQPQKFKPTPWTKTNSAKPKTSKRPSKAITTKTTTTIPIPIPTPPTRAPNPSPPPTPTPPPAPPHPTPPPPPTNPTDPPSSPEKERPSPNTCSKTFAFRAVEKSDTPLKTLTITKNRGTSCRDRVMLG